MEEPEPGGVVLLLDIADFRASALTRPSALTAHGLDTPVAPGLRAEEWRFSAFALGNATGSADEDVGGAAELDLLGRRHQRRLAAMQAQLFSRGGGE